MREVLCVVCRAEKEKSEARSCLEDFSQTLWGKLQKILQKQRPTFLLKKNPTPKTQTKNKLQPSPHLKFYKTVETL